jgi:hypothetical protein
MGMKSGKTHKEDRMHSPHEAQDDCVDVGLITACQDPQIALDGRTNRRRRRFSQGIEHVPSFPSTLYVGRFSEGLERTPRPPAARRLGSFADGIRSRSQRRVGSFADTAASSPNAKVASSVVER